MREKPPPEVMIPPKFDWHATSGVPDSTPYVINNINAKTIKVAYEKRTIVAPTVVTYGEVAGKAG